MIFGGQAKPKGTTSFVVTRANGTVEVIKPPSLIKRIANALKGALDRWH